MSAAAKITSTDAVRHFKVAMEKYEADVRQIITELVLEVRRAVDWVEHDRMAYWPREVRTASDRLVEARHALERCEMAIRAEDKKHCYEQRLALDAAKRRLRYAEEKVRRARHWRVAVKQEVDDFLGEMAKMTNFLDAEIPRAVAALVRMADALDRYTGTHRPEAASGSTSSAAISDEEAAWLDPTQYDATPAEVSTHEDPHDASL